MYGYKAQFYLLLALFTLPLAGCFSSGAMYSANVTSVELSDENFSVVATNVSGEAEASYLLGFSGSFGPELKTLALVRLEGSGTLYREAIENLWDNFEAEQGPINGRAVALVNVRYDTDALNVLGLYTRPTLSVRADVVEFN